MAQTQERLGNDTKTNEYLRRAVLECPDNVKWKIWMISARIMQNQGQMDEARLCLERACLDVPPKQVSMALLEYAKYFEMVGENNRAI